MLIFFIQTNAIVQMTKNQLNNHCFHYILHAFQIHKNALKKDGTSVFTKPTFTYGFILLREQLEAPVHDFQHG